LSLGTFLNCVVYYEYKKASLLSLHSHKQDKALRMLCDAVAECVGTTVIYPVWIANRFALIEAK
jgi:hypothetical protein